MTGASFLSLKSVTSIVSVVTPPIVVAEIGRKSAYADARSCSAISRPMISSSAVTRRPTVCLRIVNTIVIATAAYAAIHTTPSTCTPSWWKLPP